MTGLSIAVELNDPYGISHAVRPWVSPPDPPEQVHTCDPQAAIDRCLDCKRKRFYGNCAPHKGEQTRTWGCYDELDARIDALLRAGLRSGPICQELGIAMKELKNAKARLRYRAGRDAAEGKRGEDG